MKYKIKIKTFNTGRKEYSSYVKKGCFWHGIFHNGESGLFFEWGFEHRDTALRAIDSNYSGNCKVQSIEFEYIEK